MDLQPHLLVCCSQDSELHFGTSFVLIGQVVQEIPWSEHRILSDQLENRPELEAVAL